MHNNTESFSFNFGYNFPEDSEEKLYRNIEGLDGPNRKQILKDSGKISHKQAIEKAECEYEKYRVIQDQKYISSMDEFYNKYLEESNRN